MNRILNVGLNDVKGVVRLTDSVSRQQVGVGPAREALLLVGLSGACISWRRGSGQVDNWILEQAH